MSDLLSDFFKIKCAVFLGQNHRPEKKMVNVLRAVKRPRELASRFPPAGYYALGVGVVSLAAFMLLRGMKGSVPKNTEELETVLQSYDASENVKIEALSRVDELVLHEFLRKYPAFANLLSGAQLVRAVCAVVECCEYLEDAKIGTLLEY